MPERIERINQMMKREISNILLSEIRDPRVSFVTVTHVDVTKDLRYARVSFSIIGDAQKLAEAQAGLNHASGYIRKLIGQRVRLRFIPEIEFLYDQSLEYSDRIEKTLQDIQRERQANDDV